MRATTTLPLCSLIVGLSLSAGAVSGADATITFDGTRDGPSGTPAAYREAGLIVTTACRGRLHLADVGGDASADLVVAPGCTEAFRIVAGAGSSFTPTGFDVTAPLIGTHRLGSDGGATLTLRNIPAGQRITFPVTPEWSDLTVLRWESDGGTGAIDNLAVRTPGSAPGQGQHAIASSATPGITIAEDGAGPTDLDLTPPMVAAYLDPAAGTGGRRAFRVVCLASDARDPSPRVWAELRRDGPGDVGLVAVACESVVWVDDGPVLLRVTATDSCGNSAAAEDSVP